MTVCMKMSGARWIEIGCRPTGWLCLALLSACGGEASSGDGALRTVPSDLVRSDLAHQALVAEVEQIGEDARLERSGHSMLSVGQRLFVVRGVRDDFDTQTNTFPEDVLRIQSQNGNVRALDQRGEEQPGGLSYSCVAADTSRGGSFYLFGGGHYLFELDPDFFASLVVSDALYRLDVPTRRWQLLEPTGARPTARNGCAAQFFDGSVYMFAGISRFFDVNDELWKYDPDQDSWSQLAPSGAVPPARYKPATALDESAGKIYYYGGLAFGPQGFARLDDFWVYDIASNSFRELPSGISPVRDQGTLAVLNAPGGKRYVVHVGGDVPTDVSCTGFPQLAEATSEVWAFDIEAETWSLVPTEGPMPRIEYHAGASIGRRFYFAGGWAEEPDPVRTCRQEWNPHVYELSLALH
jgi:galactose oxidase-like protein